MAQDGIKKASLEDNTGIQLLLKKYRKIFRISENLNFYSEEDYKTAEKKFLNYALFGKIKN